MIKLFVLLRRGRFRKKKALYKQVWDMTFDVMLLFYVLVLVGYLVWAVVHEGNIGSKLGNFAFQMEEISLAFFWVIMTVIPVGLLFRSFTRPGIIISTAEYTATMLTYTKKQIWWMAAIARWVKLAIILTFISLALLLFSPTSGPVILLYVGLIFVINLMMTFVEWWMFQLHIFMKVFIFMFAIGINVISLLTYPPVVATMAMIGLLVSSTVLLPRVVDDIDWKKVTTACDYHIWNMVIMTYFTKQKMKKERSYTIWQRMPFWRKAFPYQKASAYQRLWHVYWQRQIVIVLQFIGSILVLVGFVPATNHWIVPIADLLGFALTPVKDWFFFIALVIGIHMYVSVAVVIWRDRLTADMMQVLPWDLALLQQTFIKWAGACSAIFLIPIWLYALDHLSLLFILQMIVALGALYFILYWKIAAAFRLVSENEGFIVPTSFIPLGYGLLGLMIASAFIPYIMLIALVLLILAGFSHIRYRKSLRGGS